VQLPEPLNVDRHDISAEARQIVAMGPIALTVDLCGIGERHPW
jgi:hypothetical protein